MHTLHWRTRKSGRRARSLVAYRKHTIKFGGRVSVNVKLLVSLRSSLKFGDNMLSYAFLCVVVVVVMSAEAEAGCC